MKLFKLLILFLVGFLMASNVFAQADPGINILTLNGGNVNVGATGQLQVDITNTGPFDPILQSTIRAEISFPSLVTILPNAQQTLPSGWTIKSNDGSTIVICNSTNEIGVNEARTIFIAFQGVTQGITQTIAATLQGADDNCNQNVLPDGDNPSNNNGQTTVTVLPPSSCTLRVTASAGTIACNGGTTTLTATTSSAAGAVEYSITGAAPFQASNQFTVSTGTYTVTAREVNIPTCSAISSAVTITEPLVVQPPTVSIIQPTCLVASGTITVTSATAGLNFSLDGGTYTSYPAGGYVVATGSHTLTAQNAGGCISTATISIVDAQPVIPAAPITGTITQPTCVVSTGSVFLSNLPSGNWTINPGAISGNTATTIVTGLAQGTYGFTVTNAAGCTSAASADVMIINVPGAPAAPAVNVTQPTCLVATGIITVTSATTGLTFSLDGGAYTAFPASGYTVAAGAHTLTVQNTSSCTSPITNITVNTQPEIPAAPTVSVVQPICTLATGTISITSVTTGLTFSLDGGVYSNYPAGGYTVSAGVHTLTAQNTNGCISAVTSITINAQPVGPMATASAGTITCFGETTILTITASGGTPPYQYSINGIDFQPGNTFITGAGTKTVTVKDANLCLATSIIIVNQPAAIIASVSADAFVCNSVTTSLIVTATGGTGTLQYSLNGGAFQPGNTFTVATGSYTVSVKDVNNCTTVKSVTITKPAILTASATAKRITQCGGTTEITVTASGGITPYTSGIGTFTRGPGVWTFMVTDAVGCADTTEINIEAPGCMNLKVYPNPARNSINVYHSIAEPGSSMQVFSINGSLLISKPVSQNTFQTTVDVSRLAAGNYIVVYLNGNEKKQALFKKLTY